MKQWNSGKMVEFILDLIFQEFFIFKMGKYRISDVIIFLKLLVAFLLFAGICAVFQAVFFEPSKNYFQEESVMYFEESQSFIQSNKEYLSQVVSVKGIVTDVTLSSPYISVILDGTLCFSFESEKTQENIQLTDTLSIKGRYEGSDDVFEEYSFTDCSVYN